MDERKMARLRTALAVMLALYCVVQLWGAARSSIMGGWDFNTYYFAAQAWAEGGNPYDTADLTRVAGRYVRWPFVYAPVTLPLFRAFTFVPLTTAYWLWLALMLACVAVLVWLWRRLLPTVDPLLLTAAIVLGFGASMVWALKSGNVILISQVLLWTAFLCFLKNRPWAFSLLMVAVGILKTPQLAFLGLLVVAPGNRRRNLLAFGVGGVLFVAIALLPMMARPDWVDGFRKGMGEWREISRTSPSSRAVIDEGFEILRRRFGVADQVRDWVWALCALALLGISHKAIRRALTSGDRSYLLIVSIILYTLVAPRLKAYTYIMLVVPTLALYLPVLRKARGELLYVVLVALPGLLMHPFGAMRAFTHYNAFFANLLLWLGYLYLSTGDEPTELVVPDSGKAAAESPPPQP